MGKKRRLNTAKAKFKFKHANHPRAKFLVKQEEMCDLPSTGVDSPPEPITPTIPEASPEVILAPPPETATITPPVIAKIAKKTTSQKKAPPTRKKSRPTPKKASKRATKKKTTSTPA